MTEYLRLEEFSLAVTLCLLAVKNYQFCYENTCKIHIYLGVKKKIVIFVIIYLVLNRTKNWGNIFFLDSDIFRKCANFLKI